MFRKKYFLFPCSINKGKTIFAPAFNGNVKAKNNDSVAQLVEQYTFNVWVLGSSPSGITK